MENSVGNPNSFLVPLPSHAEVENSVGNPNSFLVPLPSHAEVQRLGENARWSRRFTYENSWAVPKIVFSLPFSI